jgi:competence protein ComGC
MTPAVSKRPSRGPTLKEVVAVVAVLAVLALLVLPALSVARRMAQRIACVNNVKQIGLAARIFATDHNEKFPMEIPLNDGGTKEFAAFGVVAPHFLLMSNISGVPKLLICPADTRTAASNFGELRDWNISYFVGLDASQSNPQSLLTGDRNITNVSYGKDRILFLTTNQPMGWTKEIHQHAGNVALGDGSVQMLGSAGLQKALGESGVATNRLAIP